MKVLCPECKQEIDLISPHDLGQRVICQTCIIQLEVVWLYPLSLDTVDDEWNKPFQVNNHQNPRTILE
jgi:lysine biosynthesis protein LysW